MRYSARKPGRPRNQAGRRRLRIERLEDRRLLAYGATVLGDGSLEVTLDDALDQFGFQPTVFQAYDSTPGNGYDDALGAFSVFDTGASVVTFGASDQFLFSFLGEGSGQTGIPIQVPCGAVAEGVGGLSLVGHISQPGTVVADGLHVSTLSFDDDGFPVFELGIHDPPLGTVADPLVGDDALLGDTQLSDVDGFYEDHFLVFVTGSLRGQVREISSYTGETRRLQFSAAFPSEPAAGDRFILVVPETPFLVETIAGQVEDSTPGEQLFTAASGLIAQDNLYESQYLQFTSGQLTGQIRRIVEYVGASRAVYLADPLPAVPVAGDQFRILQINTTPAAVADGIQAFLGTYVGTPPEGCPAPASPSLPTIAGTPMLRPSSSHPEGLAANIRPSGALMDFSEFFGVPGFVIPVPDVRFQEPGLGIPDDPLCFVSDGSTTRNICTAPVRLPLQFIGAEVEQPGYLSEGYNVVQPHVTIGHNGLELTDQAFLFDTGAQLSLISEAQAAFFGLDVLAPEDTISVQGAGGVISDLPGYRIESLSMPLDGGQSLTFRNVWVYVLDAAQGLLDGILGMNVFNSAAAMLYEPHDAEGPFLELSFFTEQLYSLPFADVEEIEPNSVREDANPIQPGQYGYGAIVANDVDFWGTPGGSVGDLLFAYVDTQSSAGEPQAQLKLIANSGDVLAEDAGDGPGGGAVAAGVEIPAGQAGNVYYRVSAEGGATLSRYELYTAIVDPLDIADEDEWVDGTNDTVNTAVPMSRTVMTGQIPVGDVDFYSFVATEGTRIVAMADNDPNRDGSLTPTRLTLFGPSGEIFAPTSSGGDANAAGAVAQVAESGTYYVRVDRSADGGDDDYRLLVQVYGGGIDLLAAELIQTSEAQKAEAEALLLLADQAVQQYEQELEREGCQFKPEDLFCQIYQMLYEVELGVRDAAAIIVQQADQMRTFAGSISVGSMPLAGLQAPPAVETFLPTATGFVATFDRPIDTTNLNLFDGASGTWGPADLEIVGDVVGPVGGSLVIEGTNVRFIATDGPLTPDRYTVTLRSVGDAFHDFAGRLLDGNADGAAGGDYTTSFTVAATPAGTVVVSIPDFARGPNQAVNLPASGTSGIPLQLSDGAVVQTVDLRLYYSPDLLTITGATVGEGTPELSEVEMTEEGPGRVRLQFESREPLGAGVQTFVNLHATVPEGAEYAAKHILDLDSISINAGSIPAVDDDAIHLVAYFGDVTGNGSYSSLDTSRVSRMAVGLDTGFAAFPLADPVLVGDLTGNGAFSSLDTSRMSRVVVGLPVDEVPAQPSLPAIVQTGPDPKLSIPRTLSAAPGEVLTVPIEIDSIVDLTGNELFAADLVIRFDPAVLSVGTVSLGEVPLGTTASGWGSPTVHVDNERGELIIGLYNQRGLGGLFHGSLLTIQVTVDAAASEGTTPINLAASSTFNSAVTYLNEGNLTLIPSPTNASDDAIDGLVTIVATEPPTRHPYDVDGDGMVAPADVLMLINYLNSNPDFDAEPPPYHDVNGDQLCTPADVLAVINYLNGQTPAEGEAEVAAAASEPEALAAFGWLDALRESAPARGAHLADVQRVSTFTSAVARGLVDPYRIAERATSPLQPQDRAPRGPRTADDELDFSRDWLDPLLSEIAADVASARR